MSFNQRIQLKDKFGSGASKWGTSLNGLQESLLHHIKKQAQHSSNTDYEFCSVFDPNPEQIQPNPKYQNPSVQP